MFMSVKHGILGILNGSDQRCEGTSMACKTIWGCHLTLHGHFCICILYIYAWTISKDFGINKEKETCLPSKESASVHRCKRTNMAIQCETFMNCSKMSEAFAKNKYGLQKIWECYLTLHGH